MKIREREIERERVRETQLTIYKKLRKGGKKIATRLPQYGLFTKRHQSVHIDNTQLNK